MSTAVDGCHGQLRVMATTTQDPRSVDSEVTYELIQPFAEAAFEKPNGQDRSAPEAMQWAETVSPFTEAPDRGEMESETDRLIGEAFAELRDESFRRGHRLPGGGDRAGRRRSVYQRIAVVGVRARALCRRSAGGPLRGRINIWRRLRRASWGWTSESLTEQQLDEVLDRLDPQTGELTPAGEEFIGEPRPQGQERREVCGQHGAQAGKVAGAVIGPVLKKLRGLIKPLLRRVLSFAIGRLPTALQPAARTLAARFTSEAEAEDENSTSSTDVADQPDRCRSSDRVVRCGAGGRTMVGEVRQANPRAKRSTSRDSETVVDSRELEMLAEARGELIDRLPPRERRRGSRPGRGAVRAGAARRPALGINLVGRPKVVGFLAKYLAQLIRPMGRTPALGPLSNAIVDTGLRLISLESRVRSRQASRAGTKPDRSRSPASSRTRSAGSPRTRTTFSRTRTSCSSRRRRRSARRSRPTSRRSSYGRRCSRRRRSAARSSPVGRAAFGRSANTAVPRTSRSRRRSRTRCPTFGGSTVGAVLRAAGATFPIRARMHIYQAAAGTTLPRMMRVDRPVPAAGAATSHRECHPLTPAAAGLLLREPQLGVAVPSHRTSGRGTGSRSGSASTSGAARSRRRARTSGQRQPPDGRRASRTEPRLDAVNRQRRGSRSGSTCPRPKPSASSRRFGRVAAERPAQALIAAYRAMDRSGAAEAGLRILREDGEDFEEFAARAGRFRRPDSAVLLRRRLRAWVLPALATWARTNGEAFARAAAHPDAGVTIRVRLTSVPGLDMLGQVPTAARGGSTATGALSALRGHADDRRSPSLRAGRRR